MNTSMKGKPGFDNFDDLCFEDTDYYVDEKPVSSDHAVVKGQAEDIFVRNTKLFGNRKVVIQNLKKNTPKDYIPHFLGDVLKMDPYRDDQIFVSKIPSKSHPFQVGQRVQDNDDSMWTITRMTEDALCIKRSYHSKHSFRWVRRVDAPREITLKFDNPHQLYNYSFTVTVGGGRPAADLSSDEIYNFSNDDLFLIPCRKMKFDDLSIAIYVKPKNGDFKWEHFKSITYSSNVESALNISPEADPEANDEDLVHRLMIILLESDFAIRDSRRLLRALKLPLNRGSEWLTFMTLHPLLCAVTTYRRKLVIERLIVELNLWSSEWIHPILKQKMKGKPLLHWLVEDRKLTKLYDHYRILNSVEVRSSTLLNRRWLKFKRQTKMSGQTGFDDSDETCYLMTTYESDGQKISSSTISVADTVRQITAKNFRLFGDRAVVLHKFQDAEQQQVFSDFVDALKVDQYSHGCVFVDEIASQKQLLELTRAVQFADGSKGQITRVTFDAICVKIDCQKAGMASYKWLLKFDAAAQLTVRFQNQEDIGDYHFSATLGDSDATNSSAFNEFHFSAVIDYIIPCRGLSSYRSGVIGVYAKPRVSGYEWDMIKTIKCESVNFSLHALRSLSKDESVLHSVNRLIDALIVHRFELRDSENALIMFGLNSDQNTEWMPLITAHPALFNVTAYRRKLVIERLIVELRLWETEWIHCILERKVDDKPMLQWLVEDRQVSQLHDHYRVYMSRFKVNYSALLNQRWLTLEKNTKMRGKPGFGRPRNTCFQRTEYMADNVSISSKIPAISGSVHQISIRNTKLFGDRPVVLQEFKEKHGEDYIANDFADALRFGDDFVFINHVPSATYPFVVGQEVERNDGTIGSIISITAHNIGVKYVIDGAVTEQVFERSTIPLEMSMAFRYRKEINNYYFAVSAGRANANYLTTRRFSKIEDFEISCRSLNINAGDQIFIYAKPTNGNYKWICIKTLDLSFDMDLEVVSIQKSHSNDPSGKILDLLMWLRQNDSKITNRVSALEQFGLKMENTSEMMSFHPSLFTITAFRRVILIERLIVELNLLNIDLVLHMFEHNHKEKSMLEWLVEDRRVIRLYDYYRALTSTFKVRYRSALLDRIWIDLKRNQKMEKLFGFSRVDDSRFGKTEYLINGVAYPVPLTVKTISAMGYPDRPSCRNSELFSERDITMNSLHQGQIKVSGNVKNESSDDYAQWFQKVTDLKKRVALTLMVSNHRGHYSNYHPDNLLNSGTSNYYCNHDKGPLIEDWIVFKQLTRDAMPTTIMIRTYGSNHALKSMKIFGSADNEVFEEWILLRDLPKSKELRYIKLDPSFVHFAWKKQFRYFRLCSMESHGESYIYFYEFGIYGVALNHQETIGPSPYIADAVALCKNHNDLFQIGIDYSQLGVGWEVELRTRRGEWIPGIVSRATKDKICVKKVDREIGGEIISYQWMCRKDIKIPSNCRYFFKDRREMSQHVFAVTLGATEDIPVFSNIMTIDANSEFVIPLDKLVASSGISRALHLFAKPREFGASFHLLKTIDCSDIPVSKFAVNGTFDVARDFPDVGIEFEVLATEDIVIAKTAKISVSCSGVTGNGDTTETMKIERKGAVLTYEECVGDSEASFSRVCLISGGDVVNEGSIVCSASNEETSVIKRVYINTDGVFENKGVIDCGEDGSVYIKCSEFKNDGVIIPNPKVIYKKEKLNRQAIGHIISKFDPEMIQLQISDHRGHYGSSGPEYLLMEGNRLYDSDGRGPPGEDWIVFTATSKKRILPTSIAIRNYTGDNALKTVTIDGSADGKQFHEWVMIENISRKNYDLQTFAVDPLSGYFAWERAFTHFKLNVVENHGASYNYFAEFRINGIVEQESL